NTINRNIVYPFPYFLYVLESAIEDAGYTLHGDIKSDPDFINAVIVPGKKIANFEGIPEPVEIIIGENERIGLFNWKYEQEILLRGSFQFQGSISLNPLHAVIIKLNDEIIYSGNSN